MPCRTVKPGSCCNRNRLGALAEKSERGFPFHPSGGHISPCKASIQNSPASLSQKAHGTSIRCKCSLSLIPLNENKTKQKEKKSLVSGAQTMQTNTAMIHVKRNHVAQYENCRCTTSELIKKLERTISAAYEDKTALYLYAMSPQLAERDCEP